MTDGHGRVVNKTTNDLTQISAIGICQSNKLTRRKNNYLKIIQYTLNLKCYFYAHEFYSTLSMYGVTSENLQSQLFEILVWARKV